MVIENSEFDNNEDGFDTNSQNNIDWPSPQDGACPNGGTSPITHTHSCWVFMDNYVHDNNNPNVPSSGAAADGPVGTGLSVSGGRDDTIMNNRFVNNGAWGVIFVPYPDTETPPPNFNPSCTGGVSGPGTVCNYDDWGNSLIGNAFTNDGCFGNQTNGDFAESTSTPGEPIKCYRANTDTSGTVTSSPSGLEQSNRTCGQTALAPDPNAPFVTQVSCDSEFFGPGSACPPGASYPRRTTVIMHPLPAGLPSMPDPCSGVPANPWCSGQVIMPSARTCSAPVVTAALKLAKRESFRSVSVKVARGKWRRHKARGRWDRIGIFLGTGPSRNVWVRFLERINVRGHHEVIRFARLSPLLTGPRRFFSRMFRCLKLPRARVVGALITGLLLVLAADASAASARTLVVTQRHVSYSHYTSIQAAVNAAHAGDWILIDRGVYVGPVTIATPRLHLRGIDRNGVIVDGRHRVGNGITITANAVWVENLTVRNFDRKSRDDSDNGNEVWWKGGGEKSTKVGLHGWWGQYLTAYDTGLLGGYGLFASHSVNGSLKDVYASGFNDSGVYIGACRDCRALVQDALVERNGLGWSSTNAGGHMVIEDSTFRDNGLGIAPDSESNSDLPPPQDGACDAGTNRSPIPTFASTNIDRCTIFRNNVIVDNGNLSTPANSTILGAPWGVGVMLPGDSGDLIENNTIRGNPTFGVLIFEQPWPFPPTAKTVYFQAAGDRVSDNQFAGNATQPGGADIGLEGGVYGTRNSVNNCFSGNTFATSIPAGIEGTWGCQNATTPNGGPDLFGELLTLVSQSGARHSRPQPAPPRQPTMPRPCRGVPRNSLCG